MFCEFTPGFSQKVTTGLNSTYVESGSFDEDKLLELIEHVEAATGKTAKIYGTRTALRKVNTATKGNETNSDMYNLGYYGKFNGTDMVCLKQAHNKDGKTFALENNKIFVIASDDKPVKIVNEGEGLLIERDATEPVMKFKIILIFCEFKISGKIAV